MRSQSGIGAGFASAPTVLRVLTPLQPSLKRASSRMSRSWVAEIYRKVGDWRSTFLWVALAAALRFWRLGTPNNLIFDETYYAKDAYSLLKNGVEREFIDNVDSLILEGVTDIFSDSPSYVVHPPLGKWMIATGEAIFGLNAFGWRSMMAFLGVAAVAITHRTVLRLTNNLFTANLAAAALAIDGMAIVMSRTALLDQSLMFFVLVAFWALIRDIKYKKNSYYDPHLGDVEVNQVKEDLEERGLNKKRNVRWFYRLLMYAALGAAVATKWSGIWFAVLFTIIALCSDLMQSEPGKRIVELAKSFVWGLSGVAIVIGVYLSSWIGWFITDTGWGRDNEIGQSWLPQPIRALIDYNNTALKFHTGLTGEHDYASDPFGWLLMLRPTSFYYGTNSSGVVDCGSSECAAEVLALGNVVIWWVAVLAMIGFILLAILGRLHVNERVPTLIPLLTILAGWVPWLAFRERATFSFYMVVIVPFICMAFAQFITMLSGVSAGSYVLIKRLRQGEVGAWAATVIIVMMTLSSIFFYPIWTAYPIGSEEWRMRMWFDSWI